MFKESIEPELSISKKDEQKINETDFEKECFSDKMRDRLFYFLATKFSSQINQHDLEEIIQETLLKAYRAKHRFDSERSKLSTWLFNVAKNTALNHLKKMSHQSKEHPKEDIGIFPEKGSSAEDRLGAKEEIVEYLGQLSNKRRKILTLHFIEGLTYYEIAEMLGIDYKTVSSAIAKARNQIESTRKQNAQEKN